MMKLSALPKLKDKVLVLCFLRLGRTPPAQYGTEILAEAQIPTVVFEFDPETENNEVKDRNTYQVFRLGLKKSFFQRRSVHNAVSALYTVSILFLWLLRAGRPKLIITHGPFEQALGLLTSTFFRVPLVCHVHEIFGDQRYRLFFGLAVKLEPRALKKAAFLIFPESGRLDFYRSRHSLKSKAVVAYNCPRLRTQTSKADLRKRLGIEQGSFLVLYIGGADSLNYVDELASSLRYLPPHIHCLIVGWSSPGFKEKLLEISQRDGTTKRLHLLGIVEDKWAILDNVDASFCMYQVESLRTQHLATSSNKLTEAVAAGVPVIVRKSKDFDEFLDKFPVGITCSDATPKGIAKSIIALEKDFEFRTSVRSRAVRFHNEELNYEKQFAPVVKAIQELIKY